MNAWQRTAIGDVHEFGAYTFTAEAIKAFGRAYDPQPFHVDEEAAKTSIFGALCASGWHTASAMMRLLVDYFDGVEARAKAAGEPFLVSGPSPGFDDLKWPYPVYADDTVNYTAEIVAKRPSRSRPGWGLMSMTTTGVNQRGATVFVITTHVFVSTKH